MSVRKRGNRWLVTVELGRDEDGQRRRDCSTYATETEALTAEAIAKGEIAKGEWFDETDITVGAFLDGWLEYVKPGVAPATYAMWSDFVRCHMKPALGRLPLAKLTPLHVDKYEARLLSQGRRKKSETKPGLSPTTVRKHRVMLRQALKYAVRRRLLRANPTDGCDPIAEEQHEVRWLEVEEQQRVIDAACIQRGDHKGEPGALRLPILVALGTGMRRGEILALRRTDVDFTHDRISVRRGRQWNPDGKVTYRAGGKNGKGRVIAAPATLMPLLAARLREVEDLRAAAGDAWRGNGLVFCNRVGEPVGLAAFRSAWNRIAARAQLDGVRFHDLRHTHATELLRAGVHPKIVSERLGHSSVKITLDRYSHAIPDLQTEAAEKTDLVLRGLLSALDDGESFQAARRGEMAAAVAEARDKLTRVRRRRPL